MIFFLVYNLANLIVFFLPLFYQDLEPENYFFYYIKFSLIISLIYLIFSKKIYKNINIKIILKNFIFLFITILIFYFVFYFFRFAEWEEFKNNHLLNNLLYTMIFYPFNMFLFYIAKIILLNRNKKILRKLTNYNDEIEKLYNFINLFNKLELNLYQYQKLLQYVNSFIIEQDNKILGSMNIIIHQNSIIIFDLKSNMIEDYNFLISFLNQEMINSNTERIVFITSQKDEYNYFINYLNFLLEQQNSLFKWQDEISNKTILEELKNISSIYILKEFYDLVQNSTITNYYILKKFTLQ